MIDSLLTHNQNQFHDGHLWTFQPWEQEEATHLIDDLITPVRIELHTVAHDTELQPVETIETPYI
jgi:hypothetical protein